MTALFLGNSYQYPQSSDRLRRSTQKGQFRGIRFEVKPASVQVLSAASGIYRGVAH